MAFNLATNWREMFDDFIGSLKRVGETSPVENPIPQIVETVENKIEDIDNRIKNIGETADKYFKYGLIALGLIAAIVVIDTVGDVLD